MSSWRELGKHAAELAELDAAVFGVSADKPDRLRMLRAELALPFTMLSDPELATAEKLGVRTASRANLWATALLHREVLSYPKRSFLQPALFVWRRDGSLAHSWVQTDSNLTNRYGAKGRPRADEVVAIIRDAAGSRAP